MLGDLIQRELELRQEIEKNGIRSRHLLKNPYHKNPVMEDLLFEEKTSVHKRKNIILERILDIVNSLDQLKKYQAHCQDIIENSQRQLDSHINKKSFDYSEKSSENEKIRMNIQTNINAVQTQIAPLEAELKSLQNIEIKIAI